MNPTTKEKIKTWALRISLIIIGIIVTLDLIYVFKTDNIDYKFTFIPIVILLVILFITYKFDLSILERVPWKYLYWLGFIFLLFIAVIDAWKEKVNSIYLLIILIIFYLLPYFVATQFIQHQYRKIDGPHKWFKMVFILIFAGVIASIIVVLSQILLYIGPGLHNFL